MCAAHVAAQKQQLLKGSSSQQIKLPGGCPCHGAWRGQLCCLVMCAHSPVPCAVTCCAMQVLLFNLLPPPGSPALQADVPGEAWEPPPFAVEVQAAVVDAIEQVGVCMTLCVSTVVC